MHIQCNIGGGVRRSSVDHFDHFDHRSQIFDFEHDQNDQNDQNFSKKNKIIIYSPSFWLVSDYTKVVFRSESIPTTFETPRDSCKV